jgi:hypothetical protein
MKKRGVVRYSEFVGVRFEADILKALEKAAIEEDRAVASLVRIAVREWLTAREKKSNATGKRSRRGGK